MALASSTPIRLTADADTALSALSRETKVNKSALLRLAITAGLPAVMRQFGVVSEPTRRTSAATETAGRRVTPRKRATRKGAAA